MRALIWFLPWVLLVGCEDEGDPFLAQPDPPVDVSFADEVQPIFTSTCAVVGCHGGDTPEAGMDLSIGQAYDSIVDVVSPVYMEPRVSRGQPAASVLYLKLIGTSRGARMPLTGSITSREIEIIRVWIEEGAREN